MTTNQANNAAMLGLPAEIFRQVINELIEDVGIEKVAKYRLVHSVWSNEFKAESLEVMSKKTPKEIFDDQSLERYFQFHTSALIVKKATRNNTVWDQQNGLVFIARYLKERAMRQFNANQTDKVRFLKAICDCVAAMQIKDCRLESKREHNDKSLNGISNHMLPAIGTAVDDAQTIANLLNNPNKIINPRYTFFPNALIASVAVENIPALRKFLTCLRTHFSKAGENERRHAAWNIGQALSAAIRLHKNTAANVILEEFKLHQGLFRIIPRNLPKWLFGDAVYTGNTDLFYRVLEFERDAERIRRQRGNLLLRDQLGDQEVKCLARNGRKSTIEMLLRDGLLNANQKIWDTHVLELALQYGRRDVAEIFLQHGANMYVKTEFKVDTPTWPTQNTFNLPLLWQLVINKRLESVRLLLAYGGDVKRACPTNDPEAIKVLTKFKYGSRILLHLSKTEKGREQLRRRELSTKDLWKWYNMQEAA